MRSAKQSEPSACFEAAAFTLIEIVVALTIVAVVAAVAIPTVKGLERDEKIRAPIKTLGELVQQVRERAMRERRAYQIVFEHEGIHATAAMYPYEKREEYLAHLEELEAPPPSEIIARAREVARPPRRSEMRRAGGRWVSCWYCSEAGKGETGEGRRGPVR